MLGHIGINVPDLEVARSYYTELMPAVGFEPFIDDPDQFDVYGLCRTKPLVTALRLDVETHRGTQKHRGVELKGIAHRGYCGHIVPGSCTAMGGQEGKGEQPREQRAAPVDGNSNIARDRIRSHIENFDHRRRTRLTRIFHRVA